MALSKSQTGKSVLFGTLKRKHCFRTHILNLFIVCSIRQIMTFLPFFSQVNEVFLTMISINKDPFLFQSHKLEKTRNCMLTKSI